MRLNVISDLHLEFADLTLPGGDVLILSGDACEAKNLKKTTYDPTLLVEDGGQRPDRYYRFFEEECRKYSKVFYVMGNHEHYGFRYDKTYAHLLEHLPDHIALLENDCEEYEGYVFMGATLWTDMNKADPVTIFECQNSMNDYKQVTKYYAGGNYYNKLRPEVTVSEHHNTMAYFKSQVESNPTKPFIVMTHHSPTKLSVKPRYKDDHHMNGAYSSDLSEFILDHPNIKVWTHGHTHDHFDYMIGSTRVVCNPRGYAGYEERARAFDPAYQVTV